MIFNYESKDQDGRAPYIIIVKDNNRPFLLLDREGVPEEFETVKEVEERIKFIQSGEEDPEPEESSSSCFITSACAVALGEAFRDDHVELESLRSHRDRLKNSRVDLADKVAEYYEIAPHIVSAINQRMDAAEIFREIYNNMIRPTNDYLENGQDNEAIDHYYREFSALKRSILPV